MTSRPVQFEPSIVTVVPVYTTTTVPSSRVAKTLTSIRAVPTSIVTATTVADTIPTAPAIPALPTEFSSPLATGEAPTPAIVIVTLIMVLICALILLVALLYFVFLRFRGKCPNCPDYENEIKKWKNGDLKVIHPKMVQQRMRAMDLEKGTSDPQAQTHQADMRMQSLACLGGQMLSERSSVGRVDSVWSKESVERDTEDREAVESPQANTVSPARIPAHVVAAVARLDEDAEATLVNPEYAEFPKTHSAYLKNVIAPREAQAKRSLQEAEEQALSRHLDIASDPSNRESVQQRAMDRVKEIILAREVKDNADELQHLPAPRIGGASRFKERFSLDTNHSPQ